MISSPHRSNRHHFLFTGLSLNTAKRCDVFRQEGGWRLATRAELYHQGIDGVRREGHKVRPASAASLLGPYRMPERLDAAVRVTR